MSATWTPDREATLREMWARGCSASHIANELGGLGRGSVLGFIRRHRITRDTALLRFAETDSRGSIWDLEEDERREAFRRIAAYGARKTLGVAA